MTLKFNDKDTFWPNWPDWPNPIGPNFFKKFLCNNFSKNLLQIITQISEK